MHPLEKLWYRLSPLHLLLIPLSWIFAALVSIRRGLYLSGLLPSVKLPVPVIIVGNLTVGGSGKTPLTLWLAEQLIARGWRPGIISRGFGGSATHPVVVRGDSDATLVGDEPLLMARRGLCPVWIGRDRPAAAQALLHAHPECDVILSDDGLQHYRLQREVEIVLVDGVRRFGNGLQLPAGPLREAASRLACVDAVVVNGGMAEGGEYAMTLHGAQFYNLLDPTRTASAADFHGQALHAVAGIGHPARFFAHLADLGLNVTPHAFPDHHRYTASDLAFEAADALLMTEKDAVKCAALGNEKCWVLRVEAQLDANFLQVILDKLSH
jgi:tetraacyldisaccharide 4'-kinase